MGILQTLARFFGLLKRESKVLVIGLDNSGKTTIINFLKPDEKQLSYVVPTVGFNVEKIFVKPLSFTCFDMSGHTRYRNLWEHYYIECDAIIFVVDSSDHLRLCVARDELEQLLEHKTLCARRIPLLIFANKMDQGCALTASEVAEALGLDQIRDKPWNIVASNGITGQGISEEERMQALYASMDRDTSLSYDSMVSEPTDDFKGGSQIATDPFYGTIVPG